MANHSLSDGVTTIYLPEEYLWVDEYSWAPPVHSSDYTLSGAQVIQTAVRLAGRPITLQGENDSGWIDITTLNQLHALASVEGKTMTLTLADARSFQVMFNHDGGAVIDAKQIARGINTYYLTIRLIEV